MNVRQFAGITLLGLSVTAQAAPPQPFDASSPAVVQAQYIGRPYILALWSLECGFCQAELKTLAQVRKQHPDLPLVLVSTDSAEYAVAVESHLAQLGLGGVESWIFADEMPERLRFAIDRRWRGELPRTYVYDAQHRGRAFSGALNYDWLTGWLGAYSR